MLLQALTVLLTLRTAAVYASFHICASRRSFVASSHLAYSDVYDLVPKVIPRGDDECEGDYLCIPPKLMAKDTATAAFHFGCYTSSTFLVPFLFKRGGTDSSLFITDFSSFDFHLQKFVNSSRAFSNAKVIVVSDSDAPGVEHVFAFLKDVVHYGTRRAPVLHLGGKGNRLIATDCVREATSTSSNNFDVGPLTGAFVDYPPPLPEDYEADHSSVAGELRVCQTGTIHAAWGRSNITLAERTVRDRNSIASDLLAAAKAFYMPPLKYTATIAGAFMWPKHDPLGSDPIYYMDDDYSVVIGSARYTALCAEGVPYQEDSGVRMAYLCTGRLADLYLEYDGVEYHGPYTGLYPPLDSFTFTVDNYTFAQSKFWYGVYFDGSVPVALDCQGAGFINLSYRDAKGQCVYLAPGSHASNYTLESVQFNRFPCDLGKICVTGTQVLNRVGLISAHGIVGPSELESFVPSAHSTYGFNVLLNGYVSSPPPQFVCNSTSCHLADVTPGSFSYRAFGNHALLRYSRDTLALFAERLGTFRPRVAGAVDAAQNYISTNRAAITARFAPAAYAQSVWLAADNSSRTRNGLIIWAIVFATLYAVYLPQRLEFIIRDGRESRKLFYGMSRRQFVVLSSRCALALLDSFVMVVLWHVLLPLQLLLSVFEFLFAIPRFLITRPKRYFHFFLVDITDRVTVSGLKGLLPLAKKASRSASSTYSQLRVRSYVARARYAALDNYPSAFRP